jgi:PAS domain S-box-containing protein
MDSLPAVLIVDDDRVVLHTMQDQLSRESYRVAAISNVAEALQRIRIERFGIIMADQFMPETPGVEFLRICRETQPLSARMIITGTASSPGVDEAIARGDAFRVLRKPWTRSDLTLALNQATDRYQLTVQLEAATRETRRQRNDLAALGRQLENYRQQLHSTPAQPPTGSSAVETEELFRQIICHVDQAVSVSDPESKRILYLSPVHEDIWGRPLKEMYASDSYRTEAIHPHDRERVLKAASFQGQNAGTYDEQYRIIRPDGEVRWIRDRVFPIRDSEQKVYRIAAIAEDITGRKVASELLETRVRERTEELAWANLALESEISERRRAEIQLREANQRLQRALEELHATQQQVIQQERLRALGKMAGGVAHDFNNALIPILGYAELLIERSELLDDRAVALKYLRLMRTAAKDATAVVGRLREFYRQRDETELFEAVDLLEALTEAISMTQPKWHDEALAQGLHITVEQNFQPVPTIACHSGEIREVVTNLLFNAIDALPQGGTIVVSAYSQDESAVFEVRDDGIGMTEEVRVRCMEPFVTTKGERGTGLGLAMVYGIVQRHHGNIEIETKLGEGTLVRVRLPFYRGVAGVARTDSSPVTSKLKILLVDDEEVVRDVIALFLRHEEHEVEVTPSAIDALRLVREQKFDLVITDHAMPGMTGSNFVATLRSAGFDIPIVMLTGFGELMTTSDSIPAGVTRLVNKPVTMEDLRSAIAAVFQDSKVPQRRQ